MDEILRVALTTSGAIGIMVAAAYAAMRLLRQDDAWEKIIASKDAEYAKLLAENERLRALLALAEGTA
jgi:hypothetical protein